MTTVLMILAAGLVLWALYSYLQPPTPTIAPGPSPHHQAAVAAMSLKPSFEWPKRDEYDAEIVGESNYQIAIAALCAEFKNPEIDGVGTALLIPEDTNPHDDKAVRVAMGGVTVGYLSREDARTYRRRLATKKLGMCVASCGAQIVGGYELNDGQQAHYGVKLDIKPFDS